MRVRNASTALNHGTNTKTEMRLTKMIGMIWIAYVVTSLPSLLVNSLSGKVSFPVELRPITFAFALCSSCANPIIYGLASSNFRSAYVTVLKRMVCVKFKRTADPSRSDPVTQETHRNDTIPEVK